MDLEFSAAANMVAEVGGVAIDAGGVGQVNDSKAGAAALADLKAALDPSVAKPRRTTGSSFQADQLDKERQLAIGAASSRLSKRLPGVLCLEGTGRPSTTNEGRSDSPLQEGAAESSRKA
ncbi:hypothetical protein QD357_15460 [Rhizobium sp. BR 317]|uniref:hypothetical protein n=1 Tax=Rhizobium sp. BR 317 TaxID=3040015 RepID=UPI0039BF0B13